LQKIDAGTLSYFIPFNTSTNS